MLNARYPRFDPQQILVIRGELWNKLVSDVERLTRMTATPPLLLSEDATGTNISITLNQTDLWGTLKNPWNPGDKQITVTPCASATDNTATGSADVMVYLDYPVTDVPNHCGFAVNDILGYTTTGEGDPLASPAGSTPLYRLVDNPLPKPASQYQGVFNSSSDVTKPHYIADFLRAT